MSAAIIRVELPAHLRTLARLSGCEVSVAVEENASVAAVLDALEARFPMLRGTIRDQNTGQRRAFLRFFACQEDLSHLSIDRKLPDPVLRGAEPLLIIGAVAGGAPGRAN